MDNVEINKMWSIVENLVEDSLNFKSKRNFNTFLKGGKFVDIKNNDILVMLNDSFSVSFATHLSKYYREAIQNIFNSDYDIKFLTKDNLLSIESETKKTNFMKKNKDFSSIQTYDETKLRKGFTFSNYVVDEFNSSVISGLKNLASFEITTTPSVFIHGSTGRGKTHLLHAIGNYVYESFPHKKVKYITADSFGNLVQEGFKHKMSPVTYVINELNDCDVFLVDDIQSVASWGKTVEAFFHLYNKFLNQNKLIIIVSDQKPEDMKYLDERMISRFTGGLVLELLPPSKESILKIVDLSLEQNNASNLLSEEAKLWLAGESNDIRQIKGLIIRLIHLCNFTNNTENLTVQECAKFLDKKVTKEGKQLSPKLIKQMVAEEFNISIEMLESSSRQKLINIPRQLCMYLMKENFDLTYSKIGSEFGGKDHSTVMNAIKRTKERIVHDVTFKNIVNRLWKTL